MNIRNAMVGMLEMLRCVTPKRPVTFWGVLISVGIAFSAQAQTVTPVGNGNATATGAGATGIPTLTFTVEPGQNRIVFITAAFERDHCTAPSTLANECDAGHDPGPNGNFADPDFVTAGGANVQIDFNIAGPGGSTTVTNPLAPPAGDLRFAQRSSNEFYSDTPYSQEAYFLAIYESQLRQIGCTTTAACTITITLPGIDAPNHGGDEALIAAQQFNNVSQRSNGGGISGTPNGGTQGTGIVRSLVNTGNTSECGAGSGANNELEIAAGNWSVCPIGSNYDASQVPLNANDGVLLFGYNGYAGAGPMGFLPSLGFAELMNPAVLNSGPADGNYQTSTESDGFSTSFQFANGNISTLPHANIRLQSQNGTFGPSDQVIGGFMAGFTLTRASIDLGLTKTNTPGVNGNVDQATDTLTLGATTTYQVQMTNKNTYNYINDAVLTDPATANLTKTAVTCSATAGSTCPAGPLTVADLEGAGLAIPTIAPLGVVTFTITADVADALSLGTTTVTNTATITLPAGYTDPTPADNTRSDTDLVLGQIIIIKDAQPNAPGVNFPFAALGTGVSNFTLMDDGTAPGPGVANTQIFNVVVGNFTVTENVPSGWSLSNVVCSAGGVPVTLPIVGFTGLVNITTVAGQAVTCTFTNKRAPVIRLQKELPNGRFVSADQFKLDIRTGGATGTVAATATTAGSGTTVTGEAVLNPATAGTAYTLTETGAAGAVLTNYMTTYSCANATTGSTTVLPANGSGVSIPAITPVAGDDITCKFINTAKATLTLRKQWVNANVGDDATLTVTGSSTVIDTFTSNADTASELDTDTTPVAVGNGDVLQLAETLPSTNVGAYNGLLSCTGTSGLSGTTLTVGASDTAIVCTYTNTHKVTDLSITKTNTPASGASDQAADTLDSGATTVYTLVVKNSGTEGVTGAILTDPPGGRTGLMCTTPPTCSSSAATGCPVPAMTLSQLEAGVPLALLPPGGTVTVTLSCTVL